jgi:hypothetical protein
VNGSVVSLRSGRIKARAKIILEFVDTSLCITTFLASVNMEDLSSISKALQEALGAAGELSWDVIPVANY